MTWKDKYGCDPGDKRLDNGAKAHQHEDQMAGVAAERRFSALLRQHNIGGRNIDWITDKYIIDFTGMEPDVEWIHNYLIKIDVRKVKGEYERLENDATKFGLIPLVVVEATNGFYYKPTVKGMFRYGNWKYDRTPEFMLKLKQGDIKECQVLPTLLPASSN